MRCILPEKENPALRGVSRALSHAEIKSPRVRRLIADMKGLLAKERYGVALAAVQVGESVRLFVVSGKALAKDEERTSKKSDHTERLAADRREPEAAQDQIYINPVLLKLSRGKKEKHEGCLSIRGIWGEVPRAEKATIRALDEHGVEFTRGASGFLAHIFQHEMDHLEGVLYTDKATALYEETDEKTRPRKIIRARLGETS